MSIASEISRLQTAKADLKTAIGNKGVTVGSEKIDDYAALVDDIFQGIDTSDATAGVGDIRTGKTAYVNDIKLTGTLTPLDTSDATASANDILSGNTAYVNGNKITGMMHNRGSVHIAPSTSNQSISSGYHDGDGYVDGDADLVAGNIKQGITIFGVTGTYLSPDFYTAYFPEIIIGTPSAL